MTVRARRQRVEGKAMAKKGSASFGFGANKKSFSGKSAKSKGGGKSKGGFKGWTPQQIAIYLSGKGPIPD